MRKTCDAAGPAVEHYRPIHVREGEFILTTSPTPDSATSHHRAHDRRFSVGFMIGVATLLFLITSAVLYYRWTTTNEPNCVIVVETAPSLRGGEITVDNIMLSKPLKVTI